MQPRGGFNNSLDSVFSQTIPLSRSAQTGVSSIDPTPKSSTPVGAIVGGVLGGVAAIAIAIGVLLYLRKTRRAAAAEKPELAHSASTSKDHGIYSNDQKLNSRRHEVPGDFVQRDEYEQVPKPQEVPGDFTQRDGSEQVPGLHEVPGDLEQGKSAKTHAGPEVYELGAESRVTRTS